MDFRNGPSQEQAIEDDTPYSWEGQPDRERGSDATSYSNQMTVASHNLPDYAQYQRSDLATDPSRSHHLSFPGRSHSSFPPYANGQTADQGPTSYSASSGQQQVYHNEWWQFQHHQLDPQYQTYRQSAQDQQLQHFPQNSQYPLRQNPPQGRQDEEYEQEAPATHPSAGQLSVVDSLHSGRLGPLEPGYIQPHLNWFKVGKVFKAPCAEYASERAVSAVRQREDESISSFTTSAFEGLATFHEPRHYVIVLVKAFHSLCLAYHTYGGRGTGKQGIEPRDHAIIHSVPKCPGPLRGEPRLTKDSIRVINARKALHPASRLNFGKIHTIEHNRRLMPIGEIEPTHMNRLKTYLHDCTFGMYE